MYGLNPNTLRTWERRYGLVSPKRSPGGHRGYAEADLQYIESMVRRLTAGASPSEAAAQVKLEREAPQPVSASAQERELSEEKKGAAPAREHRRRFRQAIRRLDLSGAHATATAALASLGYTATVENILFPELAYLGERWEATGRGVAMEHMGTLAARLLVLARQQELLPEAEGVPIVTACAPGELHDLPVLHVSNLLAESTLFRPVCLVGGLPISEIADSAAQVEARALVLSASIEPRPDVLRQWIGELVERGWEDRTILVGAGFTRSRVFSETKVRSAAGNYSQVLRLLTRMLLPDRGASVAE